MDGISWEGQVFCVIPWGHYHYIGPTAVAYSGDPASVRPSNEEIDFLLLGMNHTFPRLNISRAGVRHAWAGVRARTYDPSSDVRRRGGVIHDLSHVGMPNAYALTEMPMMMCRHSGETIAALVKRKIKPSGVAKALNYDRPTLRTEFGEIDAIGLKRAAREEDVYGLDDLLLRRTEVGFGADKGVAVAEECALLVSGVLNWSDDKVREEVRRYRAVVTDNFLVRCEESSRLEREVVGRGRT